MQKKALSYLAFKDETLEAPRGRTERGEPPPHHDTDEDKETE